MYLHYSCLMSTSVSVDKYLMKVMNSFTKLELYLIEYPSNVFTNYVFFSDKIWNCGRWKVFCMWFRLPGWFCFFSYAWVTCLTKCNLSAN